MRVAIALMFPGLAFCLGAGRQAVAAAERTCSVRAVGLRCEYLPAPLGIDVARPRLSWQLAAAETRARGQRQTAYRVLVASTCERLESGRADLWDSGMVSSEKSVQVVYAGKPLASGMPCFWKVRVKDEKGAVSAWSEPTRWTMGLLQEADWSARWIGTDQVFERKRGWPPPDNTVADPWLRKTFTLNARPERAAMYVASVGYHELYVNGQRVGDAVLSPAVVNHR
ncbi:MAG: alpha-L-rhamnosidase N-terminal domain-containing protein, partial [Sedimentisphaerales bacterium]|nr:alpha-L-rhamnosidase N-terminal domain-containing protein [Sedimentisphaerales bacterium]